MKVQINEIKNTMYYDDEEFGGEYNDEKFF